jgi:hypothetical protein
MRDASRPERPTASSLDVAGSFLLPARGNRDRSNRPRMKSCQARPGKILCNPLIPNEGKFLQICILVFPKAHTIDLTVEFPTTSGSDRPMSTVGEGKILPPPLTVSNHLMLLLGQPQKRAPKKGCVTVNLYQITKNQQDTWAPSTVSQSNQPKNSPCCRRLVNREGAASGRGRRSWSALYRRQSRSWPG